jgi:hypothetical protein
VLIKKRRLRREMKKGRREDTKKAQKRDTYITVARRRVT